VSRTAIAPFDRLKTFLIANTGGDRQKRAFVGSIGAGRDAMKAVGEGQLGKAMQKAGSPLVEHIWRLGGVRSFFVGYQLLFHD
jgi:hypothetical protein